MPKTKTSKQSRVNSNRVSNTDLERAIYRGPVKNDPLNPPSSCLYCKWADKEGVEVEGYPITDKESKAYLIVKTFGRFTRYMARFDNQTNRLLSVNGDSKLSSFHEIPKRAAKYFMLYLRDSLEWQRETAESELRQR